MFSSEFRKNFKNTGRLLLENLFKLNSNFKMAEEHTTLNKEKLTQLIRKIFQEEFKKQEVHITNIISSNFKITMEEVKKSQEQIKELKKEVTDLKSSVEHTDADLNDLSDRVDEIYDYQVDPEYVTNKST